MNTETMWTDFLAIAREEMGSRAVDTWLVAMHLARWDLATKTAYLHTPNSFVKDWVKNKYSDFLERHLARLLGEERIKILFVDDAVLPAYGVGISEPLSQPLVIVPAVRALTRQQRKRKDSDVVMLHEEYRFDNFVVGPHNSLAYAAAHAVSEKLGTLYNPLFLYGKSGLGKTHLLHAIGNSVRESARPCRILYQSANRFVTEFIKAIRFDTVYQFEAQYKSIDLLLVDDVQSLSNKEQTQEAFFHIFNVLHQARKQIVFTSDSLPSDIAGLADRVRSRLESGLVADISEPTLETKIAIVKKKSEQQGVVMHDDVAEYIASIGTSNVRDLEGALIRVFAVASLTKQAITVELARQALARHGEQKPVPQELDPVMVGRQVAGYYKISFDELRSQSRVKELTMARHVAMFLMKRLTNCSLRDISKCLARRDHSTVKHAVDKMERMVHDDQELLRSVKEIERQLLR